MIIMKEKITGVFLAFLGICFSCQSVKQDKVQGDTHIDYNYLKSHFQNPERFYGVNCWWWWLNGNVTKEAITKDLEAMKSKNFQGAMILMQVDITNVVIKIFRKVLCLEVKHGTNYSCLL